MISNVLEEDTGDAPINNHTWNYRVLKLTENGYISYAIHEVHYEDGKPVAYTNPVPFIVDEAEGVEGLKDELGAALRAFELPILDEDDFVIPSDCIIREGE